jgi:hypothetical protein
LMSPLVRELNSSGVTVPACASEVPDRHGAKTLETLLIPIASWHNRHGGPKEIAQLLRFPILRSIHNPQSTIRN